jgi:hypothetical protein
MALLPHTKGRKPMHCCSKTFACVAIAWLLVEAAVDNQARAQAAVNVRNFIPGTVDAPVYDVDGTTRLDNEVARAKGTYYASAVHAGRGLDQLVPLADPLLFGSGDHAGYWDTSQNDGVLFVPWAAPGETVYLQFRVFEYRLDDAYVPERGPTIFEWGVSESTKWTPFHRVKQPPFTR